MGLDNFDKILDDVLSLSDEELLNLPVDSFVKDAFDTFDILQKIIDNFNEY